MQTYDEGDPVPDGLFCIGGNREARLWFEVPVRVHRTSEVRHVYPEHSVHSVGEVVSSAEPSPHTTIFEGPNTVLYFEPFED
jgi:hypothetical protein